MESPELYPHGTGVPEELVLDSSVTLAWAFEDESDPYAEAILNRTPFSPALVPVVWPLEVANALLVAERRGRIAPPRLLEILNVLASFPITVAGAASLRSAPETLALARARNLSVYDASYVELAMRRGLPLATLDARLREAAAAVGVPLYVPLDGSF